MYKEVEDATWRIIQYLEKDERKNYQECYDPNAVMESRNNHIYVDILLVKKWLMCREHNPDVLLDVCPECWQLTLEIESEGILSDGRHYPLGGCTNCSYQP